MHKVTWLLVQVWKVGGPSRRGLYNQGRGLYKQGRGLYIRGCTWYEKVERGDIKCKLYGKEWLSM